MAPVGATNVVYAWSADGTVIEGQTTDKLVVTADMIGKKISVNVTGDSESKATAETGVVEAAEGTDIAIVSASQTAAKAAEIVFNKDAAGVTIVVTKDNKTISQEILAVDGSKVTLQFGSNLVAGTYTVKATDAEKKEATGEFTAEGAVLTTVDFVNKNLLVSSNTTDGMKKAYAVLTSTDQWGNHMNISGATFTVSKESSHSFNADSGVLTINAPTNDNNGTYANANYTIGETVVVTVQYNSGQTPKVITGVLTVSLADSVKTLTFGDLTTDNATYKGGDITQEALVSGDYYFPVTEAMSEAGIKLDTDMLNSMVQSNDNPGGTLFISPNASTKASAYAYANGFVEKKINGVATPCLSVKAGNNISQLNIDLDYTLTVVSQSGLSQTLTIPIKRNAVVKTLEVTNMPAMYAEKWVEIPLKATDIYGKDYDLYDKVTVGNSYANAVSNTSDTGTINQVYVRIDDEKSNTDTNFTISSTNGLNAKVIVDTSKKTSTLMVRPSAKGYMTITGTTAGFGAINYANITVNELREATGIQGLKNIATSLTEKADSQAFKSANVIFTGADSEAVAPNDKGYPYWRTNLLQTGNQLHNTAHDGTTATVDESKYILTATDDKPEANGTATTLDVETAVNTSDGKAIILPATTSSAPVFVWSAAMTDGTIVTNSGTTAYDKDDASKLTANHQAYSVLKGGSGAAYAGTAYVGDAIILDKTNQKIYVNTCVAKTGASDTIRVYLYKIVKNATAGWDVSEVTHKDYEFTVVSEEDVTYKLQINKENNIEPKLYSHKASADSIGVTLTTTTGAKVDQAKLAAGSISFTIDGKNTDAFTYDSTTKTIKMTKDLNADGTAKMTATFDTENGKTATAEVEFGYTKEEPYAVTAGMYYTDGSGAFDGSNVYANKDGLVNGSTSKTGADIKFIVKDQYANDILVDWAADAKTKPVIAKVTKKIGTMTGAGYTTSGLELYASGDLGASGTATVVVTSGTLTKTYYVAVDDADDDYKTVATASLASVAPDGTATNVLTHTYGTVDATGITLAGTDSNGSKIAATGLNVQSVLFTAPDGTQSQVTPDGTSAGDGDIIFASGKITTDANTKAGTYEFTMVAPGYTGTATYTLKVAVKNAVYEHNGTAAGASDDFLATLTKAGAASDKEKITLSDVAATGGTITADDIDSITVYEKDGTTTVNGELTGLVWEASTTGARPDERTAKIVFKNNYAGTITVSIAASAADGAKLAVVTD